MAQKIESSPAPEPPARDRAIPAEVVSQQRVLKAKHDARKFTAELKTDPRSAMGELQRRMLTLDQLGADSSVVDRYKTAIASAGDTAWILGRNGGKDLKTTDIMQVVTEVLTADEKLRNDPHFLLQKGAEIYLRSQARSLSAEAKSEYREVLGNIYDKLIEIRDSNRVDGFRQSDIGEEVILTALDRDLEMYRFKMISDEVDGLKKKNDEEPIQDDAVKKKLEELQQRLRIDPSFVRNREKLIDFKNELVGLLNGASRADVEEAISRIDNLIRQVDRVEAMAVSIDQFHKNTDYDRAQVGKHSIRYTSALHEKFRNHKLKLNQTISLGRLEEQHVKKLQEYLEDPDYTGEEAFVRFLADMRADIYDTSERPTRPGFQDEATLDTFFNAMEEIMGEDLAYKAKILKDIWKSHEEADGIIKGIFSPGDAEKKTQHLAYLSGSAIERLLMTEYSNFAYTSLYDAICDVMANQMMEFNHAYDLYTNVHEDFVALLNRDAPDIVAELQKAKKQLTRENVYTLLLSKRYSFETKPDLYEGTPLLKAAHRQLGHDGASQSKGQLSEALYTEMYKTQFLRDKIKAGVMLRDKHMKYLIRDYKEMGDCVYEYRDLANQMNDYVEGHPKRAEIQARMDELREIYQDMWTTFNVNIADAPDIDDIYEFNAIQNLSPVEIIARNRLRAEIIDQWIREYQKRHGKLPTSEEIREFGRSKEWKIREAIKAANKILIGKGEAMQIAARMAVAPKVDEAAKDFMKGAFAEQFQRIINPFLFRDRFSMGSDTGDLIADVYYINQFKRVGIDMDSNIVPAKYRAKIDERRREGKPVWPIYLLYMEEVYGIQWTELLRPDTFATGLTNLSSLWRSEVAELDPIQKKLLAMREKGRLEGDALIDNVALGLQLSRSPMADGNPYHRHVRENLLLKILERHPTSYINFYGKALHDYLAAGADGISIGFGSKDWLRFQSALNNAQMRLWSDPKMAHSNYSLLNYDQFCEVMEPYMRLHNLDVSPESMKKYHKALTKIKEFMYEQVDAADPFNPNKKERRIDHLMRYNFKQFFMFAGADYDIADANFQELGAMDIERRINDFRNQAKVGSLFFDFMFNKTADLVFPQKGKEGESLLKMEEIKDVVMSYAGPHDAEDTLYSMGDILIELNENRARWSIGWVPGMTRLLMNMKHQEPEHWLIGKILMPGKDEEGHERWHAWLKKNGLFGVPFHRWPVSAAQLISYHAGLVGREGNKWDENRIEGIIDHMENRMWFQKHPHYYKKLRDKYHTDPAFRLLAQGRTYGWLILPAMAAVAFSASLDEEKRKEGQH